jgi:hypothetical protein
MGISSRVLITVWWILVTTQVIASPALPGEKCQTDPHPSWSEVEAWAWNEICEGRDADFFERYGQFSVPLSPQKWGEDTKNRRRLSQAFLETILLYEPWSSAIPRKGVRIHSAYLPDGLNLSNARIGTEVWITSSLFSKPLKLEGTSLDGDLVLFNSIFEAAVIAAWLQVNGGLNLNGTTFEKGLNMEGLEVDNNLLLDAANIDGRANFIDASVHGTMQFSKSRIGGNLLLYGAEIEGYLLMRNRGFGGEVYLRGARVGKNLEMTDSRFFERVVMDGLEIGSFLIMQNARFEGPIILAASNLNSDLNLLGSVITELDLSGTNIAGILVLGTGEHDPVQWKNGGLLILRNTHVTSIQDRINVEADSWPAEIQFDGFVYDRLGGYLGTGSEADMLSRDVSWYIDWLARDPSYSPQPYQQLTGIFREVGYPKKANSILYAGRERERIQATGASRIGLEMLKWTIGYGIGTRYFRALWWVVGLVGLGMAVLRVTGEGRRNKMPYGLSFSLDHLLPIVTLRKYHFDITLNGWARYYFYFHKLMGYVLASFLIAGMAGLTQ